LGDYIIALLKHDKSFLELRNELSREIGEFLKEGMGEGTLLLSLLSLLLLYYYCKFIILFRKGKIHQEFVC
jgi:hypothetical protein